MGKGSVDMVKKLLYKEIMKHIEDKIQNAEWKPDDLLPSEAELSLEFGVSRITVQRALDKLENSGLIYRRKGKGSFVCNKAMDQQVIKGGNSSKINVVALVMPFGSSLGRGMDVIQGISSVLSRNGFYLTVHISNQNTDEEKKIISNLINDGVNGIILYPVSHRKNIDLINRLFLDNYPIITIDKYFDAFPVSCVLSDNFNGSYMAASHLIELGHRELVFASDSELESATSVRDRYFGFCKALKDNSIELKDDNLVCIEHLNNEVLDALKNYSSSRSYLLDPFKKIIDKVLNRENRCTAIHALHDYMAIYLLKAALEMGINVPDELSIIGFDNIENGTYLEVPLTTVEQNFHKLGEEAGTLITDKICNPSDDCKRIILPVELIKRNSTASCKILGKNWKYA